MGRDVRHVRSVYSVLRGLKEYAAPYKYIRYGVTLNMPRSQPIRRICKLTLSFLRQRKKKKKGL